jgi:hypothetical protein
MLHARCLALHPQVDMRPESRPSAMWQAAGLLICRFDAGTGGTGWGISDIRSALAACHQLRQFVGGVPETRDSEGARCCTRCCQLAWH